MPVRVPLEFAKPTMQLAGPIVDGDGRLLAGNGTKLSERIVSALRKLAMQTVLVDETSELQPWEMVRSLDEDLRALDTRFRDGLGAPESPELAIVHQAIARYLERRWARLAGGDAGAGGGS